MFYISISNGLLKDGHRKRMGSSVWEFMWLIDKVTRIDQKGNGIVLGGKPINLDEIADGVDTETVSRNLTKLEEEGYIEKIRTPYGLSIRVCKVKKRFHKNVESNRNHKNVESRRENVESNKTIQLDNDRVDQSEQSSHGIPLVIKAFESVNPACKSFYGRRPQREACESLINNYGIDKVIMVVEKTLPKTNTMQYFPTITTPVQLHEKWVALESAIKKYQFEKLKTSVAF